MSTTATTENGKARAAPKPAEPDVREQCSRIWRRLAAPFRPDQIKTRNQGGRALSYITARAVMNRLDEVVGPANWSATFARWGEDSVLCSLTITLPDGRSVTKQDVGANSTMAEKAKGMDPGDDDKGGASDSFKRAAVMFGIGRHLYNDGVASFPPPKKTVDSEGFPLTIEAPLGTRAAIRGDDDGEPRAREMSGCRAWVKGAIQRENDKLRNLLLVEGKGDAFAPVANEFQVAQAMVSKWVEDGVMEEKEVLTASGARDRLKVGAAVQVAFSQDPEEFMADVEAYLAGKARAICLALGVTPYGDRDESQAADDDDGEAT